MDIKKYTAKDETGKKILYDLTGLNKRQFEAIIAGLRLLDADTEDKDKLSAVAGYMLAPHGLEDFIKG